MDKYIIGIQLKENFVDSHIHCGDYFLWVANELTIHFRVEGLNVKTIQVQKGFLQDVNLDGVGRVTDFSTHTHVTSYLNLVSLIIHGDQKVTKNTKSYLC
jgi:hypothetical protein